MDSLARRVSSWTTNALMTGILAVAALGFGRQVLRGWSAGGRPTSPPALGLMVDDGLGDPARVHVLEFGNQPRSVRRQSVSGNRASAAAALEAACRTEVSQASPPQTPPDEAERRLLAGLAKRTPVAAQSGVWQLYTCGEGLPMMAGVRLWTKAGGGKAGTQLAETPGRVVTWGVAVPAGPERWTLYVFQAEGGASPPAEAAEIPLPPEGKKLLSVRVADGGAMLAFTAAEPLEVCRRFYDRSLPRQGWQAVGPWRPDGSAWQTRYVRGGRAAGPAVDIRLAEDDHGKTTGLVLTSGNMTKEH
jgi:hypothetical protein